MEVDQIISNSFVHHIVNKMKSVVENCHTTDSNIVDHPFFQSPTIGDKWSFGQLNAKGQDMLSELSSYELPKEIKYLYLGLKDENESLVYEGYTFLCLKTIIEFCLSQKSSGQDVFVDLIMMYAGMGHCWIISWHRDEKKYFLRLDGGANGWECEDNYQKYFETKIDWRKVENIMMGWDELISFMKNKDTSKFNNYNIGSRI